MADYDQDSSYGDGDSRDVRSRDETPADFDVVRSVKDFVFDLHESMRRSQVPEELDILYTNTFKKLSDDYYKTMPWPVAEIISNQCSHDETFLLFYSEMRLRHMSVTLVVDLHDRLDAWGNYCSLFNMLLTMNDTDFIITSNWAFDIINEFVYQFQSFCQFRTQTENLTQDELHLLQTKQDVWAVQNVISYLHGLIRVSKIGPILEAKKRGESAPKSPSQLHQLMGYYGLIGMSRLHCLLADYHQCLNVLAPLDVTDRNDLFGSNLHAYVSLYMHIGVSFLMMKRYRDSARVLSEISLHINRVTKTGQLNKPGMEQIPKQNEKLLCLLAIATFLSPSAATDDAIMQIVTDTHKDKLARMIEGGGSAEQAFRDLFQYGCPKFIVCCVPDYNIPMNSSNALLNQQIQLFCHEIRLQLAFPKVRSYLKLYATISIAKMARFNDMSEKDFLATLVSMKHKLTQAEWGMNSEISLLQGKPVLALDFNFFIEDDTIVIDEQTQEKRFEKYFISQIGKCNDIVNQVAQISM